MWEWAFEQLVSTNEGQCNIFWPDMDKEMEQAILHHLFTTASMRGLLTGNRIERFLLEVVAMHGPEATAADPRTEMADLDTATRDLLHIDETLSPLSLMMFGRSLLIEQDRDELAAALESACRATS